MYKGNNPTALESQKMIIKGMLYLMKTQSFKSITIKSLCETSLVSRQTFYSLFNCKEEVIELYFDKIIDLFIKQYADEKNTTINYICNEFVSCIEYDKYFIQLLVINNLTYIMKLKFKECLIKIGYILKVNRKYMYEYAIAFMAGALVEIIAMYIMDNNIEKEELACLIKDILKGEYFIVN